MKHFHTLVIGAGPAGLTAAYDLSKRGKNVLVVERDAEYVGGISRTVEYKGFRFDIGGHRFFSKSQRVNDLWDELMPDDFLTRPRSSRIYYNNKFFNYPIQAFDALSKLGVIEAFICVLSYLKARILPYKNPKNFEEWTVNCFGRRLFSIFFKTYTEKVWGMKCTEISADWGAQRIKGLTLLDVFKNSFSKRNKGEEKFSTLITSFRYPRLGPGQMWDSARDKIEEMGNAVRMGCSVTDVERNSDSGLWTVSVQDQNGDVETFTADHLISSTSIVELVKMLGQSVTEDVKATAKRLKYRDFLIVAVIANEEDAFNDNWVYIHDPSMKVGRVQNFRSWSNDLVPDQSKVCYGMEYFCFEGDDLWDAPDQELIDLAVEEVCRLSLCKKESVVDASVVRQPKAYPVYDDGYAGNVAVVADYLKSVFPNLYLVGRNGMHKYNNQDHAMMTALLTVENIIAGEQLYDVWAVNQDAEYHEGKDTYVDDRLVSQRAS
jgi:protoporphyrinogen oxidase